MIVYRDEAVTVVNKPAGMLSEPGGNGRNVISAVRELTGTECRPVHRLDRGTGGLMVLANTAAAAAALSAAIAEGRMEKTYLAAVCGRPEPPEGEMRDLLFRDAGKNKSYTVRRMRKGVREARLAYRTLGSEDTENGPLTLVSVTLDTGRTHQIRVQFASRGMPLAGDGKYGSRSRGPAPALFSAGLRFPHPVTGEPMAFRALPDPETEAWRPAAALLSACAADMRNMRKDGEGADDG